MSVARSAAQENEQLGASLADSITCKNWATARCRHGGGAFLSHTAGWLHARRHTVQAPVEQVAVLRDLVCAHDCWSSHGVIVLVWPKIAKTSRLRFPVCSMAVCASGNLCSSTLNESGFYVRTKTNLRSAGATPSVFPYLLVFAAGNGGAGRGCG